MTRSPNGCRGGIRGRLASVTFILLTLMYGGVVVYADQYFDVDVKLGLPIDLGAWLLLAVIASWLLRYSRWHYLLSRLGGNPAFFRGFIIYLSGFAYTATPGKGGELVRARYLTRIGFTNAQVVAAFVFERSFDLIVVLLIASFAFLTHDLLHLSGVFVAAVVCALVLFVGIAGRLEGQSGGSSSGGVRILTRFRKGLAGCGKHLKDLVKLPVLLVSFILGLFAWLLIAVSFVLLLHGMSLTLPLNVGLSSYPLSMLAGAASMLPGGVGATEASLAFILAQNGISFAEALSAAIAIRILTLWSAILVGGLCVLYLELDINRYDDVAVADDSAAER